MHLPLGQIADVLTVVVSIISLLIWFFTFNIWRNTRKEKKLLNQEVKIYLQEKGTKRTIDIPGSIKKFEFVREEVLGRVGMVPMRPKKDEKHPRFKIKYTYDEEFLRDLYFIKEDKAKVEFYIYCEGDELDQFDAKIYDKK